MARNMTAVCKVGMICLAALLLANAGGGGIAVEEQAQAREVSSAVDVPAGFAAQDSDAIPDALREHIQTRYHSTTAREAIARSLLDARRMGTHGEGWAFLLDLHDEVITAWILQPLNRYYGGNIEPFRRRRDLPSLALGIAQATISVAPDSEDPSFQNAEDDPGMYVRLLGTLLSEAVGVEVEYPGRVARPETQRWVETTIERGIERATEPERQAWLRYCLERVRGASR